MKWLFFGFILIVNLPLQAQDGSLPDLSRQQVRQYADAIHKKPHTTLNIWALLELIRDQPGMQSYLHRYQSKKAYGDPSFKILQDTTLSPAARQRKIAFVAKSPLLLITYFLNHPKVKDRQATAAHFQREVGYPPNTGIDYKALVRAILQNTPITQDLLPLTKFRPVHFLLFFESPLIRNGTVTTDYLKAAAKAWPAGMSHGASGLPLFLYRATQFRIYYLLDDYDSILPLSGHIINNRRFPNSARKLKIMRMMDYSMYRLGYYNRSLAIIRNHSLPLARYLGQDDIVHEIQVSQGAYLYRIGKIDDSIEIYQNLKTYIEIHKSNVSKSRLFNNLAIDYWKSGAFDQYLKLQFESLKQATQEKNYGLRRDVLINLFTHFLINKDFASARQYLNKAKKLALKNKNKEDLAQISYYEGQLYRDTKSNYDRAIQSFNQALQFISYSEYYRSYQNILMDKARLLERQNKYEQAQGLYQKVFEHANERDDRKNVLDATFNKANTHLELGEKEAAKTMLDTLNTKSLEALDFYQLVKARTVQARFQQVENHPEGGINTLRPVIAQILKRSHGSGDIQSGFWQVEPEYLNAFELYANLLIDTGRSGKAVETLDRLKTINDVAIYQNPLVRSKVLNEKELSQYKRLTDQLDKLRRRLLAAGKDDQKEIRQKIHELSAQKSALNQKVSSFSNRRPVSVRQVQRGLNAHQRVLHITELNDTYYIATISRTSVHLKKIPITPALRNKFKVSISRMREGHTDLTKLYALTKLLGLNELPSYVDKLTIIPDSYLYELPMDVLPVSPPEGPHSFGRAHYLIERFETNYMTSLNDFNQPKNKSQYKYGFAGYGVSTFASDRKALIPLPEAKTEIRDIDQQLTAFDHKKMYLNDQATGQTFKRAAPDARILHLATHSRVDNNNPLFSSIYLRRADSTKNDRFSGRIFAYQLFNLNLSNELVMLNSCESGAGSYLQGTGVVGISRALRYAGAKSLVLNLWSVNDMMASEFATRFYHEINRGATKSEALQQAKLYFLKHNNANPHYWGSYMLLGNKSALVNTHRWANRVVGASFMLFFFSIALASSYVEWKKRG